MRKTDSFYLKFIRTLVIFFIISPAAFATEPLIVNFSMEDMRNLRLATIKRIHLSAISSPEIDKYLPPGGEAWNEMGRMLSEAGLVNVSLENPNDAEISVSIETQGTALLLVFSVTQDFETEIVGRKTPISAEIWRDQKIIFKKGSEKYDVKGVFLDLTKDFVQAKKAGVDNKKKIVELSKKSKSK
jgi:hypothetical protein